MRNLFCIIFLGLFLLGCKNEPRTDYVINGTGEGLYNGIRVYLNKMDDRGRLTAVDTAIVMNEKFVLDGSVDYPSLFYLTVNGVNGRVPLMIENGDLLLSVDNKILTNTILSGSISNNIYTEYNEKLADLKNKLLLATKNLDESTFLRDSATMKSDKKVLEKLNDKFTNFPYKFIENNTDNYAVLPLIKSQINNRNFDLEKIFKIYESLPEEIKNTKEAIDIEEGLKTLKAQLEAEKATAIGVKAPEFSAPTPDGKSLALSDVVSKGKITIIDFWAAWCGPCRRENPNVVKVYEKYHDKGLEIIGVGLDGRRGQQNPKEAWIKAIENDRLTWHQVSNLRYFDEIAKLYNIKAIPAMFVLDSEGKIVAKNLRGLALERKIAELLN
ncbi:TlpA disulfide reductase family protein [Winogradskyella jejuensis]|uniref:Peroxiredoxin n=1 Tax=Winogradskyella jejuensis TaxID=1089305 RepID=A0A1M5UMP9_9FLAO|nr:TlpA disulfide reductase family protein [Winogradskyella jejuensis]SHH64227.1 Peroxiredoxin [Winogradskyella jejuensis]